MDEGVYPDTPPDEDEALLRERDALLFRAQALQTKSSNTRAVSRKLVARCVEDRIISQHRRSTLPHTTLL
jgi:hypothetical protein